MPEVISLKKRKMKNNKLIILHPEVKSMEKRHIISFLLVFVLITALLPTAVSAAPEAHCSHDSQDDDGCLLHNGWTAIATEEQLDDLARNGGSGFLTQDINISNEIKINSNVELCLNGYSIIQTNVDTNIKHSVLKIEENKTLTLYDKTDNSGKITHKANTCGCGVKVSGTFVMEGGEISGNHNPNEYGGGVYIWYGSFTMNGGIISGNLGHFGGGICGFNCNATVTEGVISGNTAESYGGGVFVQGATFNMYGGEFSGNTAGHSGGGVYNQYTTLNMYGGEITENTARYHGGGICLGGPVHMSGGKISGNTTDDDSYGIYYALDDALPSTFTGGYILDPIDFFSKSWQILFCSVTFNSNDGTENTVAQYLPPDTDMLLAPNSFTRGGYDFAGWNTDPTGNGTSYSDGGAININSDIALYAQWRAAPASAPTITAQPGDASLTYGYTTGATLTVGATAAEEHTVSKYQWYSCVDASGTDPKAIDGATGASYTVPTGLSAGNYYYCCYVTAKRTDNSNTQTAVSDVATVTVSKKALTVTAPEDLTAVYGQTLADVELPDGWTWDDPLATKVGNAGENTFPATFTPTDTLNYETVTKTLAITVAKASMSSADLTDDEKPKAVGSLIEDAGEQALVTAPEKIPEGYTGVEYGVNGENWTLKIPTGKKAGNYAILVKYVGDGNHEDFVLDPITVTIAKAVYAFTSGEGEKPTYTKGSNRDLTVTVVQTGAEDQSFEHFAGVYIGKTLLKKDTDYTVKKGSTVVTILPAALDKLDAGEYTLTVRFVNGEASALFTVLAVNNDDPVPPQTGDDSHIELWIILMTVSAIAAASIFLIGRRKRVFSK